MDRRFCVSLGSCCGTQSGSHRQRPRDRNRLLQTGCTATTGHGMWPGVANKNCQDGLGMNPILSRTEVGKKRSRNKKPSRGTLSKPSPKKVRPDPGLHENAVTAATRTNPAPANTAHVKWMQEQVECLSECVPTGFLLLHQQSLPTPKMFWPFVNSWVLLQNNAQPID